MSDDKIFSLVPKGSNEDEFFAILKELEKRATPMASLRWAFYEAHVKAGFTADQALVLCQKVML